MVRRRTSLWAGLGLLFATSAGAQLASQTALVGTVTDGGGLVVRDARVVAVNAGTRDTYEATTNADGHYNIQFVRTGTYEISVTAPGFRTFVATGVEVPSNQVVRRNAVLQVGDVSETMTVTGAAAGLDTDNVALSETIGEKTVQELPVGNGRNVWSLATITPGVQAGTAAPGTPVGNFIGAGQRAIQNSLSLDGIASANNLLPITTMRPIADAVTEVQVLTGSASAEYGSYLGVHVNVVTKSGTNDLHGSAFEFFRDESLDARGYFDRPGAVKNPFERHQFGGQLNGPVVIPGLYDGRNRTFFMFAYERIRQESTASAIASVPTALMRQGNFSETTATIRNPRTGAVYPGQIIPRSDWSPVAEKLLAYYPEPTGPGVGANFLGPTLNTVDADQILARVDQNIGSRDRVTLRLNWQDESITEIGAIPSGGIIIPRTNTNTLLGWTRTFTSNIVNDFRVGHLAVDETLSNPIAINGPADAGTALGIPGFDGDTRFGNPGIPTIAVTGFSQLGNGGTNWPQKDRTFQLSDVLAWNRGSHNIRAGFDLRRQSTSRQAANNARGLFDFNGGLSGYSVADFLLGIPRTIIPPTDQVKGHVAGWRNGFFVNDTWQATRQLTLNLGLRYERHTPVETLIGRATMLNAEQTQIIPATIPSPGFQFHEPNNKDFAPRLGATYRLKEKTVLRAGFGIYYNPNHLNSFTFLTNNPPIAAVSTFTNDNPARLLSFESPFGVAGPAVARPDMITPSRDLPNARKDQWSLDVQHEVLPGTVLDLQYIHSHTRNLDRSFYNNTPLPGPGPVDARRPNPLFRQIRTIQNDLEADYDGVSLILRQRMKNGLQLDAHYTWSRTRDMANNSNSGAAGTTMNQYDVQADYGRASWDVPHRFVAAYVYDVPFFKTSERPLVKWLLSGWQVSGVTTLQSGLPINVSIASDVANVNAPGIQRPDVIGTPTADCGGGKLVNCIDASAFALPAPFTFGNAPRNLLRGPGLFVTDMALAKSFPISKRGQFQLRIEAFNVLNHPNFLNPGAQFGTATFGQITSAASMRQVQLGGRLVF
jgi:outer membrane receptor protein involved in Fe transport